MRLTHLPTKTVVYATEERSQHKNREVAWGRLKAKLEERARDSHHEAVNSDRASHFEAHRDWSWTEWRDEVKRPDGSKFSMKSALSGRLDKVLS